MILSLLGHRMLGEPAVAELGKLRIVINNFLAGIAVIGVMLAATAAAQPDRKGTGSAAARQVGNERTSVAGTQRSSAMHWMAFNGDVAGVKELIVAGGDVNARLKTGGTPLHLAAYRGHVEVAKVLIEHGAEIDARTREGVTPLDWAQRNGHERMAMLLIAHGAGQSKPSPMKAPEIASAEEEQGQEQDKAFESVVTQQTAAPPQQTQAKVATEPAERSNEQAVDTARAEPPTGGDGHRIQLGAFSSEQRARQAWEGYREKFPDELGGLELIIDRASVKGRDYSRVQAGPMDRQDAWGICNRLKRAGQACAVMKRASP